jgi:hypothetical protein
MAGIENILGMLGSKIDPKVYLQAVGGLQGMRQAAIDKFKGEIPLSLLLGSGLGGVSGAAYGDISTQSRGDLGAIGRGALGGALLGGLGGLGASGGQLAKRLADVQATKNYLSKLPQLAHAPSSVASGVESVKLSSDKQAAMPGNPYKYLSELAGRYIGGSKIDPKLLMEAGGLTNFRNKLVEGIPGNMLASGGVGAGLGGVSGALYGDISTQSRGDLGAIGRGALGGAALGGLGGLGVSAARTAKQLANVDFTQKELNRMFEAFKRERKGVNNLFPRTDYRSGSQRFKPDRVDYNEVANNLNQIRRERARSVKDNVLDSMQAYKNIRQKGIPDLTQSNYPGPFPPKTAAYANWIVKAARIKMAKHLLRVEDLSKQLSNFDVAGLTKAAAQGHSKTARLKYAALAAKFLVEKQAFVSLMAALGNIVGASGIEKKAINIPIKNMLKAYHGFMTRHPIWGGIATLAGAPTVLGTAGTMGGAGLAAAPYFAYETINQPAKFLGGIKDRFVAGGKAFLDMPGDNDAAGANDFSSPYMPKGFKPKPYKYN